MLAGALREPSKIALALAVGGEDVAATVAAVRDVMGVAR